jgi:hypothetical protein
MHLREEIDHIAESLELAGELCDRAIGVEKPPSWTAEQWQHAWREVRGLVRQASSEVADLSLLSAE